MFELLFKDRFLTDILYLLHGNGDALLSCDQGGSIKRQERSALFGILVWPLGGSTPILPRQNKRVDVGI